MRSYVRSAVVGALAAPLLAVGVGAGVASAADAPAQQTRWGHHHHQTHVTYHHAYTYAGPFGASTGQVDFTKR